MAYSLLLIALGSCFAYFFGTIIYNLYLSPLRHIPGPFFARATGQWLLLVDLAGRRASTIHNLHKKYGAVVRIAPNELSFNQIDAMSDIYGPSSNYVKGPVYDMFGRRGLFQMRNREEHKQRQKLMAHIFAPASILSMEPLIHVQIRKLLAALERRLEKPIDMLYWFRMLALDVVGELFLGSNFGALDSESPPEFIHDLDVAYPVWCLEGQFPLLYKFFTYIPEKRFQHWLSSGHRLYEYGDKAFRSYLAKYGRCSTRKDFLTRMLVEDSADKSSSLTDTEISVEITNMAFAATDTTGNTFTYLFWELAKHPEWQSHLRKELKGVNFVSGIPSYKDVVQLPVLDALIQEVLRLHPAAPTSLQRFNPTSEGKVAGVVVPAKTIISSQSFTTQRDPSVFPSPDAFSPSRWLDSQGGTETMREHMLVWGKGNRACIGRPMAGMELKLATAAIMKRFNVRLASEKTNEDMQMTDHFVVIPKGERCLLIFGKAGDE